MEHTNGVNGVNGIKHKARSGSRSLPFMTDTLGNSLNDRLLFAVPKSMYPTKP
jgi:ATP phosphoribosyltransferase